MAGKPWTSEEDQIIRQRYHENKARGLLGVLPGRTAVSIQLRAKRLGMVQPADVWREGQKRCPKCKQWKPLDEFYENKRAKNGKCTYCKECAARHNDEHRKDRYPWLLKRKYGMTLEQFEHIYLSQHGKCAICDEPIWRSGINTGRGSVTICVDHCHKTGAVRGLLCVSCNSGLGHFRDNPDFLRAAFEYLESSNRVDTHCRADSQEEENRT